MEFARESNEVAVPVAVAVPVPLPSVLFLPSLNLMTGVPVMGVLTVEIAAELSPLEAGTS